MDLDRAVLKAREAYAAARPVSSQWTDRANAVMPGGNTRSVLQFLPFPFRVERAEQQYLWDVDGHRYLNLLGNYTAGLLGHSPQPVLNAARTALESGWSLGSVNANEVTLAELLVERFASLEQLRFTNSGTEANLMALALATHHTDRSKIIVFENGYHGGVLTFGTHSNPINVPHDWVVLPYNDVDAARSAFATHAEDIAAVLVEPMQGSGGCIPGDPTFLTALRTLCTESDALLIFDEVMTSRFARGGAQQLLGITPDLTTLGKYLAGGLTFGAFGGRRDVMVAFDPTAGGALGHAGTFNNNVTSMAAGVAALTEVLTDERLDATNTRGEHLRASLNERFTEHGLPMTTTGTQSLMTVHGTPGPVHSATDLVDADDRWKELLFFHLLASGVYIARRGFVALSIEVTDADIAHVLSTVDDFCTTFA